MSPLASRRCREIKSMVRRMGIAGGGGEPGEPGPPGGPGAPGEVTTVALNAAIAAHAAAADPHAGYQKESEKAAANGYASLDAAAKLPLAQLPAHAHALGDLPATLITDVELAIELADYVDFTTFDDHSARHENGGLDELSVAGLSGLLADAQTPLAHIHAEADITGLVADLGAKVDAATFNNHKARHQDGGADEIAVGGLSGVLADPQPPIIGAGAAQAVAGNDPRLTNARTPTAHAVSHQPGGTDAMAVDAAAATGSLRTLGAGAQQATAGNDARLSDARTPTAHALESAGGLHTAAGLTAGWVLRATGAATFAFGALVAGDIPNLDTAKLTTGRLIAARLLDGTDGFLLSGKGAGVDPAYSAPVTARLTADNAAIAAAVPTTAVVVANLVVPVVVNGEYDVEWILHVANSVAADVFVVSVTPSAGTFTGRVVVMGASGVPTTGAAVPKEIHLASGVLTTANANAPGATGTIGLITTIRVRVQGKQTVAGGNLQVSLRAGTNAAASSGTATVKTGSQVTARRAA